MITMKMMLLLAALADDPIPISSVCELTTLGKAFHGRVIQVRGTYRSAFEASILTDARCDDRRVWVQFADTVDRDTPKRVLRRWERAFEPPNVHRCDNVSRFFNTSVDVTFVGRFAAARTSAQRFGHLNGYDYELTVLKIERVGHGTRDGADFVPEAGRFTIDCEMANRLPLSD